MSESFRASEFMMRDYRATVLSDQNFYRLESTCALPFRVLSFK